MSCLSTGGVGGEVVSYSASRTQKFSGKVGVARATESATTGATKAHSVDKQVNCKTNCRMSLHDVVLPVTVFFFVEKRP